MRDPKRIDRILRELEQLWRKHPDLRLGQVLEMVWPEAAPRRAGPGFVGVRRRDISSV